MYLRRLMMWSRTGGKPWLVVTPLARTCKILDHQSTILSSTVELRQDHSRRTVAKTLPPGLLRDSKFERLLVQKRLRTK